MWYHFLVGGYQGIESEICGYFSGQCKVGVHNYMLQCNFNRYPVFPTAVSTSACEQIALLWLNSPPLLLLFVSMGTCIITNQVAGHGGCMYVLVCCSHVYAYSANLLEVYTPDNVPHALSLLWCNELKRQLKLMLYSDSLYSRYHIR